MRAGVLVKGAATATKGYVQIPILAEARSDKCTDDLRIGGDVGLAIRIDEGAHIIFDVVMPDQLKG